MANKIAFTLEFQDACQTAVIRSNAIAKMLVNTGELFKQTFTAFTVEVASTAFTAEKCGHLEYQLLNAPSFVRLSTVSGGIEIEVDATAETQPGDYSFMLFAQLSEYT